MTFYNRQLTTRSDARSEFIEPPATRCGQLHVASLLKITTELYSLTISNLIIVPWPSQVNIYNALQPAREFVIDVRRTVIGQRSSVTVEWRRSCDWQVCNNAFCATRRWFAGFASNSCGETLAPWWRFERDNVMVWLRLLEIRRSFQTFTKPYCQRRRRQIRIDHVSSMISLTVLLMSTFSAKTRF